MRTTGISHHRLSYQSAVSIGLPGEGKITIFQHNRHILPHSIEVNVEFREVSLAHAIGSRQHQLVPEQGLQGIETQAIVTQEIELIVVALDVLLMQPVDHQYIIGCKLDARGLRSDIRNEDL